MHAGALQNVPELHVGLRTGYCGSLTTFASWEYSLVTGLIGGAPASTVQPAQGAA
jgi:fluoride ion exporter CrcB/FEX